MPIAARCAAASRTNTMPASYGTFSHLCASVPLDAADEMPEPWARAGPQAERAVNVEPRIRVVADDGDDPLERIERAAVHLARLRANDGRLVPVTEGVGERGAVHAALVVRGDA